MSDKDFTVTVIDSLDGRYLQEPDIEREVLKQFATVSLHRVSSHSELDQSINNTDAIISWHTVPLPKEFLSRLQCCRGIVRAAVGFDNIDIDFAAERGIPVCNVPDYGTEEVADHTLALILSLIRKLHHIDKHVRANRWEWQAIGSAFRIRGKTLGIIGFGRIGTAVAQRAKAFGFDVGFYDPYCPSGFEKSNAVKRYETLNELIDHCKVITIHVPLSEETKHLISYDELKRMVPETILINTARGEVINKVALIQHLLSGNSGYFGLDVLEDEPIIPIEIQSSEKVILTGHSAFFSNESLEELRYKAATSARNFLTGQKQRSIVNGVLSKK